MKDIKLDQVRPLGGRTSLERPNSPAKKPGSDFGKALEVAQSSGPTANIDDLKKQTQAVIEKFERDTAQFNELMRASQNQAKLIQSMMNRKPDSEA
jgi:hypothetical protein